MNLLQLKKYTYQTITLIFIMGTVACQKTLDLNITTFEPSIAIFGVLEADSVPKLFVTESEPYYTYVNRNVEYQLIENANITITDGNDTWTLQPDSVNYLPVEQRRNFGGDDDIAPPKKSWAFTANIALQANTTYTLSVAKNNNTATATTTVIEDIGNFDTKITEEEVEYYYGNFVQDIIEVNFKSQSYGQSFRVLTRQEIKLYICDFSNGLQTPKDTFFYTYINYHPYQKISDTVDIQKGKANYYSGNCVIYSCGGENEFLDFTEIEVAIQVIDSNMVTYVNQLQTQEDVAYNPFLEPAPVDHKVENGIGILSSSAISPWKKIKILCD